MPSPSTRSRTPEESFPSAPRPCALQRVADRVGDRAGAAARSQSHPRLRAFLAVVASGYVAVAAVLIVVGLLLTNFLLSGPVGRIDEDATSWFADHRTSALNSATNLVSRSGDTLGAIGIAVIVAIALAIARRWQAIAALVVALALELTVFLSVNFVVDRPRPDVAELGSQPSTSSFPSGHTAATTVIYVLVLIVVLSSTSRRWLCVLAWCAAVAVPVAVGLSRVYRGMHHPIDVVAGVLMGIAALTIALIAVRAERAAAIAPPERATSDERELTGSVA